MAKVAIAPIDDEITDLQWLLLELDRIDGCAHTKALAKAVVRSMAGRRVYFALYALENPEKVNVARALLDVGAPMVQVRNRLVAGGYCDSHDTAYRIIRKALDQRGAELAQTRSKKQTDFFGVSPSANP
jgi:hypothetical protein